MPEKIGSTDTLPSEYGEPHEFDPNFKGPIKKRSCTDVICLILFIVFLIGWVIVAILAALNGDPERLLYPTDSRGRVCGRDEAVKDRPYLFFFDLTRCASPKVPFTGCPTPQVCVKKCPSENWFYLGTGTSKNKSKLYCKENADLSKSISDLVHNQDCSAYYVHSHSIGGRCIPRVSVNASLVNDVGDNLKNLDGEVVSLSYLIKSMKYLANFLTTQKVAEGVVEDVRRLWPYILVGCVIAMVVSFLWIILLRLIASIMVWLSLILFTGLCGYVAYYTLDKYLKVRSNLESREVSVTEIEFTKAFSKVPDLETTWLVFFIITICVFIICLLVLIFLRKRITLAIALINEASKAVGNIMSTLFFPVIPYLMHLVFLLFFCVVALLLASAGSPQYRVVCSGDCSCSPIKENGTCNPSNFSAPLCTNKEARCQFYSYESHPIMPKLHIYNLFALFWTMCFVSALCEMVLAGAFSSWYWSFNKPSDVPSTPVLNSLGRTFRYHLGSLAFGALIIAIIRMIRVIFEYIDYKLKKHADYKIIKIFTCFCRCCLWCLEKFLRFINRNAYIYCAIYGTNFCTSARKAFSLIMRNVVRVVVLDKVTDFLLLIGKLVVTGGMALLAFFFFSGEIIDLKGHLPEMNYYLTPVILITIATFFISSAFFDVYNMAVDTLFFCFLEDSERNDGSPEKPYFMSKNLMKILNKSNKLEVD